jgi:dethiobiotin synthetase
MEPGKPLFITATDTGVGKTMVSGLLLDFLIEKGVRAGYQKWAATGCEAREVPDLKDCLQIAGHTPDPDLLDLQVPYRLAFPASPHLAAEMDGVAIDPEKIIHSYRQMAARYEVLVVEGIGGLLVPLNRQLLLADLLCRLGLPTLIVARSGLGTINHTLLTIEALRSRRIPIVGVLFTDSENEEEIIARDNMRVISELGGVEVLGRLSFSSEIRKLIENFKPIGEKLFNLL